MTLTKYGFVCDVCQHVEPRAIDWLNHAAEHAN